MTPQTFIAKWRDNPLTECAGAQAHVEDLCALLEREPPRVEGEYQYERGLSKKSSASQGCGGETHTHFTDTPSEAHSILLENIGQPETLQKLRWLFNAPERFNAQGHTPLQTAHFLIAAYGRTDYTPKMPDEAILKRLLTLNLKRSSVEAKGIRKKTGSQKVKRPSGHPRNAAPIG